MNTIKLTFQDEQLEYRLMWEPDGEGGEKRWIEERFPGREWIMAVAGYGVATEILRLNELARGLLAPLLDCLRNAADLDGHAIYDLLAGTGIIRREPYDLEVHKGGEYVDSEPGDEIWVLTELGKRFAGKEG
jgi:hypothetical protein